MLTAPPDAGAFTNDIVTEALANLQELGVDTTGDSYQPTEVTLQRGRRLTSAEAGRAGRSAARPNRRSSSPAPYHPDRWRPCCC